MASLRTRTDVAWRHEVGRGVPVDLARTLRLHEQAPPLMPEELTASTTP
jgi:hypothetical protein